MTRNQEELHLQEYTIQTFYNDCQGRIQILHYRGSVIYYCMFIEIHFVISGSDLNYVPSHTLDRLKKSNKRISLWSYTYTSIRLFAPNTNRLINCVGLEIVEVFVLCQKSFFRILVLKPLFVISETNGSRILFVTR